VSGLRSSLLKKINKYLRVVAKQSVVKKKTKIKNLGYLLTLFRTLNSGKHKSGVGHESHKDKHCVLSLICGSLVKTKQQQ
jgi:hypothetical protein